MKVKLSARDEMEFARLEKTFDQNERAVRLWQAYLEACPSLADEAMVKRLCTECRISQKEAVCQIVAASAELDERGDDREFYQTYIRGAVRELDTKRYEEDEYFKNIRFPSVKYGAWEFKTETYPPFRLFSCNDLCVLEGYTEVPPIGYFDKEFSFPAVLEDENEWMTLTPVDMDTSREAIDAARGKVITFGLGLGYFCYHASNKESVQSVTVIEKSEDVISLFQKHILPQFENKEKIRIINADAFEYAENKMGSEHYDVAFVDTWRDASDGAPMYMRMKPYEKNAPDCKFYYWIEEYLLSAIRRSVFEPIRLYSASPTLDMLDIKTKGEVIDGFEEIYHRLSKTYLRRLAQNFEG